MSLTSAHQNIAPCCVSLRDTFLHTCALQPPPISLSLSGAVAIGMTNSRVKIWKCGSGSDANAPISDGGISDLASPGGGGAAAAGACAGGSSSRQMGFVGHAGPVFSTAIRSGLRVSVCAGACCVRESRRVRLTHARARTHTAPIIASCSRRRRTRQRGCGVSTRR